MEIPEKDYDEFEGRLKKLSYATDYIPSSEDLVCVMEDGKLRRPNIGICTAAGMLLGYALPKLLEMMMYG